MKMKAMYAGHLTLTAIDRLGNRFIYDTPNIITYGAAKCSAHALVGETAFMASDLAVGTGSTAAARGDTALVTEAYRQSLGTPTFPFVGQVEFAVTLDFVCDANGFTLREAGIFTVNNTLLARQVHSSVSKDSNFQLEYRWRIVFT
jgi:hypothetical protein